MKVHERTYLKSRTQEEREACFSLFFFTFCLFCQYVCFPSLLIIMEARMFNQ